MVCSAGSMSISRQAAKMISSIIVPNKGNFGANAVFPV